MEQRIVALKIAGEHIMGAGVPIGAVGSHDEVLLEMDFRPSRLWVGTTRRAIFSNALGEDRTVIILGTNLLAEGQSEVYLVPVPQQAKSVAGECFLTVEGFVRDETTGKECIRCVTQEAAFRVLPSKLYYNDDTPVTPSQAEQLQAEIDHIKGDIVEAAKAADAKEAAQEAQAAAEQARDEAEAAAAAAADQAVQAASTELDGYVAQAEGAARNAAQSAQSAGGSASVAGEAQKAAKVSEKEAIAQAERARREADRAKQAAGGEFLTAVDMEDQLAEHLRIGEAELMKAMPIGGALFVTGGETPEGLVPEGELDKTWEASY